MERKKGKKCRKEMEQMKVMKTNTASYHKFIVLHKHTHTHTHTHINMRTLNLLCLHPRAMDIVQLTILRLGHL